MSQTGEPKTPRDKIKITGDEVTINGTARKLDDKGNIVPIKVKSGILGETERVVDFVARQNLQKKLDAYRAKKGLSRPRPG